MKILIRTIAAVLLVAGLAVSTHSQSRTVDSGKIVASAQPVSSLIPAPACVPDDPDACGVGDPKGK